MVTGSETEQTCSRRSSGNHYLDGMHGVALNRQLGVGFADTHPLPIHRGRVCTRVEIRIGSVKATDEGCRIDTAVPEFVSCSLACQRNAVGSPKPMWRLFSVSSGRACAADLSPAVFSLTKVATSSLIGSHAEERKSPLVAGFSCHPRGRLNSPLRAATNNTRYAQYPGNNHGD